MPTESSKHPTTKQITGTRQTTEDLVRLCHKEYETFHSEQYARFGQM